MEILLKKRINWAIRSSKKGSLSKLGTVQNIFRDNECYLNENSVLCLIEYIYAFFKWLCNVGHKLDLLQVDLTSFSQEF